MDFPFDQAHLPDSGRSIAVLDPDPAAAYRLKARLLVRGYRRVDVYLSPAALKDALDAGYRPDTIVDRGKPVSRESYQAGAVVE